MSTVTQNSASIIWSGEADGWLDLIDQTLLPTEMKRIECRDVETVWEAIKMLRVRGAPAIGISAAYGVVIGVQTVIADSGIGAVKARAVEAIDYLATSRPTAVNLFWALDRMRATVNSWDDQLPVADAAASLLQEAKAIHQSDRETCHAIGTHGCSVLDGVQGVLTHCNAGGLAAAEYGTALSVFFTAQDQGKSLHVFVDETRPLLQGARLTAWELMQRGIEATLICDSMAAQVMREGKVQAVVTGADRIAANGDSANKIGTYSLAVLAKHHGIPFYIAAPASTFDLSIKSGDQIPIELRDSGEITNGFGRQTAPDDVQVYNPAFDVTPADLIEAIITEHGLIQPVTTENVRSMIG